MAVANSPILMVVANVMIWLQSHQQGMHQTLVILLLETVGGCWSLMVVLLREQPPEEPTPVGAFRFNTDTAKLEYYDGNQWVNITTDSPETTYWWNSWCYCRNKDNPQWQEHLWISSILQQQGMAQILEMTEVVRSYMQSGATAKSRGVVFGGYGGSVHSAGNNNQIEFVTIASQGDAQDFGDLIYLGRNSVCYKWKSNKSSGITFGATTPELSNVIDFVHYCINR